MNELHWDKLIVERRVEPRPLDDGRFREWMNGRPVFVSSRMDEEMEPARQAVRGWLKGWGAQPVMWEEVTPRDQHPESAYLEGVERSSVYVLLAGRSYGAADETGYSPTHKEGVRAAEIGLPRLVFEDARVRPAERDGRLNDWLRSLYAQVSAARYHDPEELTRRLELRLREIAAAQETPWIKLGNLVFPGSVSRRRDGYRAEYRVEARIRDGRVRRAVSELGGWSQGIHADRLTWGSDTREVRVESVEMETRSTSEEIASIRCVTPDQARGSHYGMGMTINGLGPSEQAEIWVRRTVLGENVEVGRSSLLASMLEPEGPSLREVLTREGAQGWVAEGLIRLYLVEGLLTRFGGHFERLEIGPATSMGVRVDIRFVPDGHSAKPLEISGQVRLV